MGEDEGQTISLNEVDKTWLLTLIDPKNVTEAEAQLTALYRKLKMYFSTKGCSDPENLAQDTVWRAIEKIKDGTTLTCEFEAFCFGIARNVSREDHRKPEKKHHYSFDDPLPDIELAVGPDIVEKIYQGELLACLLQCLQKWPECQLLLRYSDLDAEGQELINARKKLAVESGISAEALRGRMLRLRRKLECCMKNCIEKK